MLIAGIAYVKTFYVNNDTYVPFDKSYNGKP